MRLRAGFPTEFLELWNIFAEMGRDGMDSHHQLRSEGRHKDGIGKHVLVLAFKDGQYRVYGGMVTIARRPTFVCTELCVKKTQKADQKLLQRAARHLGKYRQAHQDEIED